MPGSRYEQRDGVLVEGGSAAQQEVLELVFDGMPRTLIEAVRVSRYELGEGATGPVGHELHVTRPAVEDLRLHWEALLAGRAFRELAAERGLPPVVWVETTGSGWTLDFDAAQAHRPARQEVEEAVVGAAAATGALLDRIDFFEPRRIAVAVTLAVPEPHGYLRHGLRAFIELGLVWDQARNDSFVEVLDGGPEPAFRTGGGGTSVRADLRCCSPFHRGTIFGPSPPDCRVTPRTQAEMLAAFVSRLGETTGRSLDEWLALLLAVKLATPTDRLLWLKREHDLSEAEALAIVSSSV
jgi:hypothetical protein